MSDSRRKMITFTPLGARIVEQITGPGISAGDYLSELMRQRYHAWQEALEYWGERTTRAELRAALEGLAGYIPDLADRAGGIQRKLPHAIGSRLDHQSAIALCDLALEYASGNQLLIEALNKET